MRPKSVLLSTILFVLLSAAGASALEAGDKAPPFVNLDLTKRHVLSRSYLAQGWVIMDFFATDCEGCKKELPVMEQLQRDYSDRGLQVLVFATDPEGAEVVVPFFENRPTPCTVLLDHYQVTVKKYGVEEIPTLFLIDPRGIIIHKEVGYREDLYGIISSYLGS